MPLKTAEKAIIAAVGFVWGLARIGQSAGGHWNGRSGPDGAPGLRDEATASRLDKLEAIVFGVSSPAQTTANVTEREMVKALREMEIRIRHEVADRMKSQGLAIDSLREMIEGTDALLEKVLDRLEAVADEADLPAGASSERMASERTAPDRIAPRGRPFSDLRGSGRP